jgi:L-iditol 2-dehydrogenase
MIPRVPTPFGHELAGMVVATGRGVRGLREGDRVAVANSAPCGACGPCRGGRANLCEDLLFVNGAYAERILLPPRLVERNAVVIDGTLPAARAAMAEPLACALHGVARGGVEAGMAVVIIGHGPLGWLLAMGARQAGARPILVGKPGWRLERARAAGVGEIVEASSWAATRETIGGLTGGRGADVAIDATGRPEVWEQAIECTARGGTAVLFGGCAPGTTIAIDTRRAHYEELALVGAFHHTPALIRRALELLATGAIITDALVTGVVGLAGVPGALDAMAEGRALKVQVDPGRD